MSQKAVTDEFDNAYRNMAFESLNSELAKGAIATGDAVPSIDDRTESNAFYSGIFQVSAGETYKIKGTGGAGTRLYAIYDSAGNLAWTVGLNYAANDDIVRIREDEATLVVNIHIPIDSNYLKKLALSDNLLAGKLDKSSVKQTVGASATDVMSQKAITDEDADLYSALNGRIDDETRIQTSSNIASTEDVSEGFGISAAGDVVENASYRIGGYFPIAAGEYTPNGIRFIALYDWKKRFLSRIAVANSETFSITDNRVAFGRISSNAGVGYWQLNKGAALLDYEPYAKPKSLIGEIGGIADAASVIKEKLNLFTISDSINNLTQYGLTRSKVSDCSLKIFGTSANIFYFNCLLGANQYTNSSTFEFEKNLQKGTYTVFFEISKDVRLGIMYTESTHANCKGLKSGDVISVGDGGGCLYIYGSKPGDIGTEEDPTIITFALYAGILHIPMDIRKETAVDSIARAAIDSKVYSRFYKGDLKTSPAMFAKWYKCLSGNIVADYSLGHETLCNAVYGVLDALVDNDYVTKAALGSDESGEYSIYEYVFKPRIASSSSYPDKRNTPKMLIDGGIHGFEKFAVYGAAAFFIDLATNWQESEALSYLRNYVEFHFIPISNPWGFDEDARTNVNGVNLNRNFATSNWEYSEDGYHGSEPFDQAETAVLRDWVLSNEDALFWINLHTNGHYNVPNFREMNACMPITYGNPAADDYYRRIFPTIYRHIETQSLMWPAAYPSLQLSLEPENDYIGKLQAADTIGATAHWCMENTKVMALVLEGFNGVVVDGEGKLNSRQACEINAENIGNMVIQILCEYSR